MTLFADRTGLHAFDWLLIALYAIVTIGLGVYFSRKQRNTDEYFTGSRNMNPIFIGVSLFATLLSTISYLSMPGEAAGKGPVVMIGLLALPLVYLVVGFFLLPVYMKQRVTSAYELLEERLGLSIRLLGATMFLALRLVWMTLLVYLAAKAMTVMMGVDYWVINFDELSVLSGQFTEVAVSSTKRPGFFLWQGSELTIVAVPVVIVFTGFVSLIYTSLGGLRAVVVTDFMQTVLLFGGALLVLATVTYHFGGFGWFPTRWQPTWDTQPIVSFDPRTRVTAVGTILTILAWYVATLGGDQTSVQRFMATRDAAAAKRAVATQLCVGTVVQITLFLVGFALLSYYLKHSDQLPTGAGIKESADDLFPLFISKHLPVGVSGLVVAAMFAAAMSSIDSGVNSITAVVQTDFLGRLGWKLKSEKAQLRAAQLMAFGIGVTVVFGSSFMKYIEGNITAVTNKTVNLLTTPIFALFFFALFVRWAKPLGVWIGAAFGVTTAAAIAFSGPLVVFLATQFDVDPGWFGVELMTHIDPDTAVETTTTAVREMNAETGVLEPVRRDPISFQWIGPVALVVNISVGMLVSWFLPTRRLDD